VRLAVRGVFAGGISLDARPAANRFFSHALARRPERRSKS
jgi:hypothetical protein